MLWTLPSRHSIKTTTESMDSRKIKVMWEDLSGKEGIEVAAGMRT